MPKIILLYIGRFISREIEFEAKSNYQRALITILQRPNMQSSIKADHNESLQVSILEGTLAKKTKL